MNHRHLLPDEIDLLLDGEVGFGIPPLRAHVRECAECRGRVEESRAVVETLERLPRLVPSPQLASRIMAEVQVFVPWHVAAMDTVRHFVPRSAPARIAAGAAATVMAGLVTAITLWMVARFDLFAFFVSGLAFDRLRAAAGAFAGQTLASLLGEPAARMLLDLGAPALALAFVSILTAAAVAAFGLRALATASSRRHS